MRCCLTLVVAQVAAYSGRTAPGRLAWVDRYLLLRELSLFADDEPSTTRVFADIGIGDDATTTLELAAALQQDADAPLIVACEADANRCAAAREACAAAGVVVRQTDGAFLSPKVILRRPSRHRRHAVAATPSPRRRRQNFARRKFHLAAQMGRSLCGRESDERLQKRLHSRRGGAGH